MALTSTFIRLAEDASGKRMRLGKDANADHWQLVVPCDANGDPLHTEPQVSVEGKQRVIANSYLQAVAEGLIADHTLWSKIGFNDAIGSTEETLWPASSQYVWPAAAAQMEVVSSNVADASPAGTGALTVRATVLLSDYSESTEDLALNGTTPVPTVSTDILRVNSFRVLTAGSTGAAVGNLTLRGVSGGTTYSYIRAGKTRARCAVYTVPAAKTIYVTSIAASASVRATLFTLHANWDENAGAVLPVGLFWPHWEINLNEQAYEKSLSAPMKFGATTDIKMSAACTVAGGTGTCHLRGWIE